MSQSDSRPPVAMIENHGLRAVQRRHLLPITILPQVKDAICDLLMLDVHLPDEADPVRIELSLGAAHEFAEAIRWAATRIEENGANR